MKDKLPDCDAESRWRDDEGVRMGPKKGAGPSGNSEKNSAKKWREAEGGRKRFSHRRRFTCDPRPPPPALPEKGGSPPPRRRCGGAAATVDLIRSARSSRRCMSVARQYYRGDFGLR